MATQQDPSRLLSQLLNTGLSTSNQPLYQLLRSIVQSLAVNNTNINTSSTTTGIAGSAGRDGAFIFPSDGEDGESIVGPPGKDGRDGISSPVILPEDPQEPDFFSIKGDIGPTGANGTNGINGANGKDGVPGYAFDNYSEDNDQILTFLSSITAAITGSGTTGKIPKWASGSSLTDSIIVEFSSKIGIYGSTVGTPGALLDLSNNADSRGPEVRLTDISTNTNGRNWVIGNAVSNLAYGMFGISNSSSHGTTPDTNTRLAIDLNGNVGIGTTSPASILHVKHDGGGTITVGAGDQVRIDSGVSGHIAELHFTDNVTSDGIISFIPSATAGSRYLNLTTRSVLGDLAVFGSGGVAIGNTTDPGAGNLRIAGSVLFDANNSYDIGTSANRARKIYIGAGTLSQNSFTTSSGAASLGANCPAVTLTAPLGWMNIDVNGSTAWIPIWA